MLGDKRNYIRFKTLLNLEVKPYQISSEYLHGIVTNFSYDGLSFIIEILPENFNLEPKETLELIIKHPAKDANISAFGEIVWKRQVNDRCCVGLKIREMDEEAKIEILEDAFNKQVLGD